MILVTGTTGFVGRQVVRALSARGVHLRLVVRSAGDLPVAEHAETIVCPDVFAAGADWWRGALQGVDSVVHLAWYAEPGEYLQSPRNLACLAGTIELARACAAAGTRRFIGIGTCAEYDLSAGVALHPGAALKPQTLYAACKAAVFQVLGQFLPAAGTEFAWCRLFYLHGEGEDGRRLVPTLHRQLAAGASVELTSGRQVRDFIDVARAGELIAEVTLGEETGPLNICSGIPVTIRELAEAIADQYGRRDLLRFGARPDNLFDPPYVVGIPLVPCTVPKG